MPVSALYRCTPLHRVERSSGQVTAEVGTGDRYKLDGYVNVPIGKQAAFRFAGLHQWFGGYWHNKLDGKRYGGTDDTVLRGSFHAKAGPSTGFFAPIIPRSRATGSRTSAR